MSDSQEEDVWPPPPDLEEPAAPPKTRRVTDQAIGRISLGLSALGSLCALIYAFLSVAAPHAPSDSMLTLQLGSAGCFVLAFFVGGVGWFSWEGKVGLCLALLSPLWILVWLVVDAAHGP